MKNSVTNLFDVVKQVAETALVVAVVEIEEQTVAEIAFVVAVVDIEEQAVAEIVAQVVAAVAKIYLFLNQEKTILNFLFYSI